MRPVHNKPTERRVSDKRGSIVLELALLLPFLLILFIVIVDLGIVLREHQVIQNAAREGARFSSLPQNAISRHPVNCSDCVGGCTGTGCKTQAQVLADIQARVVDYLANEGITISASDVTVDQTATIPIGSIEASASEVTVTYSHTFLVPGAPLLSQSGITMIGRSVFRNLY